MKKFKSLFFSLFEKKLDRKKNYEIKEKYRDIDSKRRTRDGKIKIKRCNCEKCQKGRQCRMNKNLSEDEFLLNETIVNRDNKYVILSHKGKVLGTYDTKSDASKRLRQIEYFKRKNNENI